MEFGLYLTPGHNLDNFDLITGLEEPRLELGRRHRLAIVLNNNAPREQPPAQQEVFDCARQPRRYFFAVRPQRRFVHERAPAKFRLASQSFQTGS